MKLPAAITPGVLLDSLAGSLPGFGKRLSTVTQPWRVGLCISGGPDSMALAYLLRTIAHPLDPRTSIFAPYAFIVDHDAREGSSDEAAWVGFQLEKLDIETHITKLTWPVGVEPGSMRGFEKEARSRRYHALANMAAANSIDDLFTGHHQDDQVETILLRLLRDRAINPLSFQGMLTTSLLPECDSVLFTNPFTTKHHPTVPSQEGLYTKPVEQFSTGMRLHRPLLPFDKGQILATCKHYDIPFVQDRTNFDPTLTARNAVRHLRSNCKLPKALESEPLLQKLNQTRAIQDKMEQQARDICKSLLELRMHSQSGALCLRLRDLPSDNDEDGARAFSYFISRMIALVSPLPAHRRPTMLDRNRTLDLLTMLRGGSGEIPHKLGSIIINKAVCQPVFNDYSPKSRGLLLSRQPLSLSEEKSLHQSFDLNHVALDDSDCEHLFYSEPRLWDNRFWLRITTHDRASMANTFVRPFKEADMPKVKQTLQRDGYAHVFEQMLSKLAPGHIRYTLPVLVQDDEVVAFPTLGFAVNEEALARWDVWYPRDLRSTQLLFPDIQNGDVRPWSFRQP